MNAKIEKINSTPKFVGLQYIKFCNITIVGNITRAIKYTIFLYRKELPKLDKLISRLVSMCCVACPCVKNWAPIYLSLFEREREIQRERKSSPTISLIYLN